MRRPQGQQAVNREFADWLEVSKWANANATDAQVIVRRY
jgi:hypothetical protein